MTFLAKDLDHFDASVLAPAAAVVSMREVFLGANQADVIGLRHDVDDNQGSLANAVSLAGWEADRGYRSTYFMLHTASYWNWRDLPGALDQIAEHGHEIAIHANAITASLLHGGDPIQILTDAIEQLRATGHKVSGVAPHGDKLCYATAPEGQRLGFVNDEIFTECPRPELGPPDRAIVYGDRRLVLAPVPLSHFGLEYETYKLPHGRYLSDSGGSWNVPCESVTSGPGQLHVLQHPDWWGAAFGGEHDAR